MAKQQLEFEATVSAGKLNRLFDELRNNGENAARNLNSALGGTVKKTILLETRADETGARKLVAVERERLTAVDRIIRAQQKLDSVQRGSVTSLRQQVNEAKQARDAVSKYVTSIGPLGQKIRQINNEWVSANSKVATLSRQLDIASASTFWQKVKADLNVGGLANFSNGLVQITQGFQAASIVAGQFLGSINKVVDTAAQLQQFALSFKAIGQGAAGGADALKRAERISLGLGVSLNTVEESFRQLSPVILNTGGTIGDVDGVTEALSSRFAAFGISGDKARRVMNGVIQAFAKGKLQAEELTQQISEADPAFKTDFARALKTAGFAAEGTTAELEKLVKAGEITANVLIKTIPLISKSSVLFGRLGPTANTAVDALERGSVTIDQVRANLQTLNTLSLRNLASAAEPVINAFFRIQAAVTDFITRISESKSVKTFGDVLGRIAETIARLVDLFLTLAEGALRVIDAIAPLVSAILKIPGVMELAGLAILGKFLKPLKLLEKQRASVLSSQKQLVDGFRAIWKGSTRPISEAKNAIDAFRESTQKPLTGGRVGDTNKSLAKISKNAAQASLAIDSVADKATQAIDKKISRVDKRIANLRKKIIIPEPVTAKPVRSEAKGELAAQENQANNLRNQLAALQTQAAQIRPTGISEITDETVEFGNVFKRVSGFLDQGVTKFGTYKSTVDGTASAIARSTLVIRKLTDESGQGIGRTFRIDPKFLTDVQRLSTTDPAKAIRLLQLSLKGLQEESKLASQTLLNADDKTKQLFKASLREGATEVKSAIAGISAEAKNINIGKLVELDRQQASIRQELSQTESAIGRLKAELEAPLKDRLSPEITRQQAEIRKELEKTEQKRRKLLSRREKISSERTQQRREFFGFDPSQIKESQTSLEGYLSAYREARATEQLGSDPIASEFRTKIQEAEKQLKDFTDKANKTQVSIKAAFPVAGAAEPVSLLPSALVQEIDQARTNLKNLRDDYSEYQRVVRSNIGSATDFSKVLGDLSKSKSSGAQRLKALAQANDFFKFSIQSNINKIKEQQKSLGSLIRERNKLRQTGAGKGFAGQGFTPEDANRLRDLNNQIGLAKGRLRELQGAQGPLASAGQAVSRNLETVAASATLAGRAGVLSSAAFRGFNTALGLLGGGLKNVFTGVSSLVAGLGPLQVLLLAVGVTSRLYADGNREAAATAKEFKDQVELLRKVLQDTKPTIETSRKSSTALGEIWRSLSIAVTQVADRFSVAGESIASSAISIATSMQRAIGPVGSLIASFALVSGSVALFTKIGASIGAFFGGAGALPGAKIGAGVGLAVGVIVALGASSSETSKRVQELERNIQALANGAKALQPDIDALIARLEGLRNPKTNEFTGGNLESAQAAYRGLSQSLVFLKEKQTELTNTLKEQKRQYEANKKTIADFEAQIKALDAQIASEQAKGAGAGNQEVLNNLRAQRAALQSQLNQLKQDNPQLANLIIGTEKVLGVLGKQVDDVTPKVNAYAKELGMVTEEQASIANSTGKLAAKIKELQEQAQDPLGFDLLSEKGRAGLDRTITKAQDLQQILDFVSKTKYEINIETKKLDQEITDAQLRIDIDPGPIREIKQLSNQVRTDISIAAKEFERSATNFKQAAKEGSIDPKEASAAIEQAAKEFLVKTRDGAANIIDAARNFRDQLKDAQNSLTNLKLSNPDFFTRDELRENARQINAEFDRALAKVREETGDFEFSPRLRGETSDEVLASKQRFIETRKEADDLNKAIKDISFSLDVANEILAKIAGVELESIKKNVADVNGILGKTNENLEQATKETTKTAKKAREIGQILGTMSANGQEYVMFLNKVTGQTETLTRAQFEAKKKAEDLAASGVKAGREIGEIFGTISADGQQYVMFLNNATGQTETLTRAQFEAKKKAEDLAASGAKAGQKIAGAANKAKQEIQGVGDAATATGTKIASSVQDASSKAVGSISRVGEITGTITANGQTIVLYFDRLTNSYEAVSQAAFDRLKSEKSITKEYDEQSNKVKSLQEYLGDSGAAQSAGGSRRGEIPSLVGPGDSYASGDAATIFLPAGVMDEVVAEAKNIGREVGGNFQAAVLEITARGLDGPLFSPGNTLLKAKGDIYAYKDAVDQLNQAKQDAAEAENAHKLAVHENADGVEDAANRVNAAYAAVAEAEESVRQQETPYRQAIEDLKEYNIALESVPLTPGALLVVEDTVGSMADQYNRAYEEAKRLSAANQELEQTNVGDQAEGFSEGTQEGATNLSNASGSADSTAESLRDGAEAANGISDAIQNLDGLDVNVNVNYSGAPARWTGGPVSAGTQYQVNELGQEGFLSASGRLSAINRPRNALWRAPSSGTVIPADIWANMNIPTAEVRANKPVSGGFSSGGGLAKIAKAIQAGLAISGKNESVNELAAVQAHQAMQIGKLGRAVDNLASKDWSVNVKVKNTGNAAYLEALNHRM